MNILHVIDSAGVYGAEVMLLNLMGEQVRLGHDPTLASIGEPGIAEKPLEAAASRAGVRVKKLRMRTGPNIQGALELLRFIREDRFDLIHSHGYKPDIFLGLFLKNCRKPPLLATIHGWTGTEGLTKLRLYEWLDSRSLASMDAVVLVSGTMRQHPRLSSCDPARVYVVNNGICPAGSADGGPGNGDRVFCGLDRAIVDFCRGAPTVGAIGRLSPEKGFERLLDALPILVEREPAIRLVILGEGPERASLERRVAGMSLKSHVLLPGYRVEARKYLPLFSVFVLPSVTEGLPITLLEAMAAGVPVVSTRVGGVPELLRNGEAGVLLDDPSGPRLAECVAKLLHYDRLRTRITTKARAVVDDSYSSASMAAGYEKIYSNISPRP
jgi:glycosyltransferase involved in cell wall biosynthesis